MELFPGNSQEFVLKNCSLEIPKNFHKVGRHFLRLFSSIGNIKLPGIGYKKFLEYGYEKFLGMGYKKFLGTVGYEKFLGMGYEKFPRMGFEKILGISVDSFTGFSRKDSWELPRIFCKIVTWGGPHCSLKVNSITDCRLLLPYCSFILFYPRLHIVFTHCPPLFRL